MANIIVKDVSGLTAALNSAQAGDTIKLAAGDYASLSLSGLKFAGAGVTITSLDPANEAKIVGMRVNGCEGLNFNSLEWVSQPGKTNPFQIVDSARINLNDLNVHGTLDGNAQNDSSGILIRRSADVTLTNSEFHQLSYGVSNLDSKNIKIDSNKFHEIQFDGVRGGGTSNITVSNNYFTDFSPVEGDHPDAIQFWTANTTTAASNITITGNVILRGDGAPTQGIFFRDQVGNLPFQNVTIADNLVIGGTINGIKVNGGAGVTIRDNVVAGLADQESTIGVEKSSNVTLTNNAATEFSIDPATNTATTQVASQEIATPNDGGLALINAYLAAHATSPIAAWGSQFLATATESMLAMDALRADLQLVAGTAGADKLSTDIKRDTIIEAGAGNDMLTSSGVGHNTLIGGDGDDTYRVSIGTEQVVEMAGGGSDTVSASVDYTLGDHVERLALTGDARKGTGNAQNNDISGTAYDDVLSGMGGDDELQAGAGNDHALGGDGADTVYGSDGNDTVEGGEGADRLRGDAGNDSLSGGGGNDLIDGSAGADQLSGGLGADMFQFGSTDTANGDVVFDFNRAQGDKIGLSGIDANANATSNNSFTFVGASAFSKVAGQLRYEVSGTDAYVMGDVNGDGIADFKILVKGVNAFQASDFLL